MDVDGVTGVRLVRATTPELILRGLRCLMGGPEKRVGMGVRGDAVENQVRGFLEYGEKHGISSERQVIGLVELEGAEVTGMTGRVVGVCLWVTAAGKTALLFCPSLTDYPEARGATRACVEAAIGDAEGEGVEMVQVMLDPKDAAGVEMFTNAGMRALATLLYLERRVPGTAPGVHMPPGMTLEAYGEGNQGAFKAAIEQSYEETLDCPALTGMRDMEDVISGHKAVGGGFDPSLWWVVMEGGRPMGCLLLANIAARDSMEVVYLGISPEARGRGLGRALMQRTMAATVERGCAMSSLAVDEKNVPALKLYRRFGYGGTMRRMAMVKKLGGNPGGGGS